MQYANPTKLAQLTNELIKKSEPYTLMGNWDVDLVNNTIFWSDETKEIHEVPLNYNCNLDTAFDFFKDEVSVEKLKTSFQKAITKNERYDLHLNLTTAKGNTKQVRTVGIPVFENGKCIRIYGVLEDITHLIFNQNIERKQKDFFEKTFNESSVSMGISNLDGKFLKVNSSFCKMLGYTETEMLTKTFKDITHPNDLAMSNKSHTQFKEGKITNYNIEKRYLHKNGSTVYGLLSASMIKPDDNTPAHFIVQITNISSRYKAEKKVKSLLDVTADQNRRLLNFAHIVSHNLRSHSGNLTMLLDLIKDQHPEIFENEMMSYLQFAVGELKETITHLNEVVSVHTNSKEKAEKLKLREHIDKTLNVLSATVLDTKCKIINTVREDIEIEYVQAYLESVLLNLISNAIKYRSPDRDPILKIYTKKIKGYKLLYIEDNGVGIDLEQHGDKLFGMYKTFHGNEDAKGIGLFLTKNQIEAMQGKIEVESTVNKGTTFIVYFKLDEPN